MDDVSTLLTLIVVAMKCQNYRLDDFSTLNFAQKLFLDR